jgi:hypothetical protein
MMESRSIVLIIKSIKAKTYIFIFVLAIVVRDGMAKSVRCVMTNKFEVSFKRIEYVRFYIEAKNKTEVRKKIKNCEWDLGEEKVDEIENKSFKINEIKETIENKSFKEEGR